DWSSDVCSSDLDALFEQVLVDVDQPATREYLVELVPCQLVIAGAATDDNSLDVKIVESGCHAMEQYAVVRDDFLGLVVHAVAALRVATTQIPRRQHRLNACMPQHGLSRQAHLREQPLRPATRKIKHGLGIVRSADRVTNDGYV